MHNTPKGINYRKLELKSPFSKIFSEISTLKLTSTRAYKQRLEEVYECLTYWWRTASNYVNDLEQRLEHYRALENKETDWFEITIECLPPTEVDILMWHDGSFKCVQFNGFNIESGQDFLNYCKQQKYSHWCYIDRPKSVTEKSKKRNYE